MCQGLKKCKRTKHGPILQLLSAKDHAKHRYQQHCVMERRFITWSLGRMEELPEEGLSELGFEDE